MRIASAASSSLEVRRAHEAALEARPARRAIDRNAAEVPVAVEHMLEPLPASLKVAGPVPHRLPLRSAGMVPSISEISYSYSPGTDEYAISHPARISSFQTSSEGGVGTQGGTDLADGVSTAVGEARWPPRACRPARCGGTKVAQLATTTSHDRQSVQIAMQCLPWDLHPSARGEGGYSAAQRNSIVVVPFLDCILLCVFCVSLPRTSKQCAASRAPRLLLCEEKMAPVPHVYSTPSTIVHERIYI